MRFVLRQHKNFAQARMQAFAKLKYDLPLWFSVSREWLFC